MPVVTIPPELKKITPYVRRAEELDKDKTNAESRLVAYYCRQYAVHTGISLATSAAGKTCLGELLSELEQEKEAMNQFTREEAKFLCRLFANKIFDKADNEDRMGEASKGTAKTFYAAASFLEILNQFYNNVDGDDADSEEVEEIKKKAVYGKWKATEILKAIKEGRRPTPGGYGEEEPEVPEDEDETGPASTKGGSSDEPAATTVQDDGAVDDETQSEPDAPLIRLPSTEDSVFGNRDTSELSSSRNNGTNNVPMDADLPPPPAYDFAPPPLGPPTTAPAARGPSRPPMTIPPAVPPAPAMVVPPPAAAAAPAPAANPSPEKKSMFGFGRKQNNKLSKAEYADAVELTKFAMAAMEDKNSELAAERLAQALEVLNRNK